MKKRNWVIMMSAAALAMASVTGCSSQNGGETTAKVENAGGSKDGASADGVKEITMWYQENKTMIPAFDQRVEDFNKKYEGKYHLTIEYIPRGSSYAYEDKVNSAAAAGILPDLLSLDGPNVSNYAANGIIVPITSYVSEESKNDMLPSTVLQNTYQNDMYAVSFNEAVSLFYYNKDVFEEHGFRIPEGIDDAYTLDEVYEMAKEVSTPEMVGIKIIMNKGEGLIYGLSPLFDSAGAPLVSEDGSKADATSTVKRAWRLLLSFRNSLMISLPILILHLLNSRIRRQQCGSPETSIRSFSLMISRICIGEQPICQKQAIM